MPYASIMWMNNGQAEANNFGELSDCAEESEREGNNKEEKASLCQGSRDES